MVCFSAHNSVYINSVDTDEMQNMSFHLMSDYGLPMCQFAGLRYINHRTKVIKS